MADFAYTVHIADGPYESFNESGFSARCVFLVPWSQRLDFARVMRGTAGKRTSYLAPTNYRLVGASPTFTETTIPYTEVDDVQLEPFLFDPVSTGTVDDGMPLMETRNGTEGWAQVTVTWRSSQRSIDPSNTGAGGFTNPNNPQQSSVKMQVDVKHGLEILSARGRGFTWQNARPGLDDVPSDVHPGIYISSSDYTLTAFRVKTPPLASITALKGKANNGAFTMPFTNEVCPAETLMFLGAGLSASFGADSSGNPEPAWTVSFMFKQRMAWGEYGWNHLYDPDSRSFRKTDPLVVRIASFGSLFNF